MALPSLAAAIVAALAAFARSEQRWWARQTREVPVLNMADLSADMGRHRSLLRASATLGVFRLQGHGVDGDAVLNASRIYFAQPEAVKRSARSPSGASGGFERGYIPLAGESGLREFVELKEGFCYGRTPGASARRGGNETGAADAHATCEHLLMKPNAWPDPSVALEGGATDGSTEAVTLPPPAGGPVGEAWRRTLLGFLEACLALSDELGVAFAAAMGRRPSELGQLLSGGESISLMRLFHYFPPEHAPHVAPGVPRTGSSPHTDWHLMTIILQDTTGGLEVRRPTPPYDWVPVPANPGELIVIVGDYLSALSDGTFVSPVHRVLLPDAPAHRYSFTFFRYPHCGATLPAPSTRRAERRAARSARERKRHAARHAAGAEPFNTLVAPAPDGDGLDQLAARSFGELLIDKWNGVAANKVSGRP